jgi:hypothetical protein
MSDDTPRDKFETVILQHIADSGPEKSFTPEGVARAVDPENWRARLREIRTAAIKLMKSGEAAILRKGKPVEDPDQFKGVYRISGPR